MAEFDLEAKAGQMIAHDRLGAPLGQTALKLISAAGAGELLGGDLPLARTQELDATDAHAGVEERLDQAAPFEHLEHRWLKRSTPSLVMWFDPAFDHTWPDAMTHEFAGREQSGRTRADDQHRRRGSGGWDGVRYIARGGRGRHGFPDVLHRFAQCDPGAPIGRASGS